MDRRGLGRDVGLLSAALLPTGRRATASGLTERVCGTRIASDKAPNGRFLCPIGHKKPLDPVAEPDRAAVVVQRGSA